MNDNPVSSKDKVSNPPHEIYDVIIVGAGIQGVGIAQACAINNLSVLVLEKHESAGKETSSKSSKLIHGGLRYLESFSFSLVRECLRERRYLLQNASSLVFNNHFYIPVYADSKRPWWFIYCGLWLYAWLAGDFLGRGIGRIKKKQWRSLDGLNVKNLRAVLYYVDAQTDDCNLSQQVALSAIKLGAKIQYKHDVQQITYTNHMFSVVALNNIEGDTKDTHIEYENIQHRAPKDASSLTGNELNIGKEKYFQSRVLVNASGPWINEIAKKISPAPPELAIDLVQGSHIIIDRQLSSHCFYSESKDDGRAVFILPWKGKTMVGTTEHLLTQGPDSISVTPEEIEYLLRIVNHLFPDRDIQKENIVNTFAGARVLPRSGAGLNARTREVNIVSRGDLSGYFAIYGGKLTAYRATAEAAMKDISALFTAVFKNKPLKTTREVKLDET